LNRKAASRFFSYLIKSLFAKFVGSKTKNRERNQGNASEEDKRMMIPPIDNTNYNVNNPTHQNANKENPVNQIALATIANGSNVPTENKGLDTLAQRLKSEKSITVFPEFDLSIDNFHTSFLADIRKQLENQFCLNQGISLGENGKPNRKQIEDQIHSTQNPKSDSSRNMLSELHFLAGDFKKAVRYHKSVHCNKTLNERNHDLRGILLTLFYKQKRTLAKLNAFQKKQPLPISYQLIRAYLAENLAKNPGEMEIAHRSLAELIEVDPKNEYKYLMRKAVIFHYQNLREACNEIIANLTAKDPSKDYHHSLNVELLILYCNKGHFSCALIHGAAALKESPKDPVINYYMALIYFQQMNYSLTIDHLRDLDPHGYLKNDIEILYTLSLLHAGFYNDALKAHASHDSRTASYSLFEGINHLGKGELQPARKFLTLARKLFASEPSQIYLGGLIQYYTAFLTTLEAKGKRLDKNTLVEIRELCDKASAATPALLPLILLRLSLANQWYFEDSKEVDKMTQGTPRTDCGSDFVDACFKYLEAMHNKNYPIEQIKKDFDSHPILDLGMALGRKYLIKKELNQARDLLEKNLESMGPSICTLALPLIDKQFGFVPNSSFLNNCRDKIKAGWHLAEMMTIYLIKIHLLEVYIELTTNPSAVKKVDRLIKELTKSELHNRQKMLLRLSKIKWGSKENEDGNHFEFEPFLNLIELSLLGLKKQWDSKKDEEVLHFLDELESFSALKLDISTIRNMLSLLRRIL
jgi:hypothetical protein